MKAEGEALALVLRALTELGIRYFIGGSVASALRGIPRTTIDVDIVAEILEAQIAGLVRLLNSAFYLDEDDVRLAIRAGRSFNIIHLTSAYKFDIFPAQRDAYHVGQMKRAQASTALLAFGVEAPTATAEDILLEKLRWYRLGGEVSDHQWNDLRGIRDVQGDHLDRAYLARWAGDLGVEDLLRRLLAE